MAYIQETLVHQSHPKTVMTQMQQLQTQQVLCDLTLLTKDGGNFPVHKLVMISGSEYFKTLLDKGMLNAEGLIMHDITCNSLQQLITYLYTGVAYVNKFTIMQLYTAASQLSIVSLKRLCRDYVRRNARSMGLADDLLEEMKTVWAREDAMARQKDTQPTMITSPIGSNTGFPAPVAPSLPTISPALTGSENAANGGKVVYYPDEMLLDAENLVGEPVNPEEVAPPVAEKRNEGTSSGRRKSDERVAVTENLAEIQDAVKDEPGDKVEEDSGNLSYGEFESTEGDNDEDYHPGGADEGNVAMGTRRKGTVAAKLPVKRKRDRKKTVSISSTKPMRSRRSSKKPVKAMRKTKKPIKPVTESAEKPRPIKLKIRKSDVEDYNKFICRVCGDGFRYDTFLKLHKLKEHASTIPTVGMHFFARKYRRIMYNPRPVDGVFHCLDCEETFANLSRLRSHEIKRHPKFPIPISLEPKVKVREKRRRKYSCNLCQPQRYFLHLNLLRKHNGVMHGDVVEAESVGQRRGRSAQQKNTALKPKPKKRLVMTLPLPAPGNIMCQLCKLPIANQVELAKHLQLDHDVYTLVYNKSKIKLQCPDCRKACAGNRNTYKLLRKHIRSAHGTDIARQCFYCGRNMNSRTSLNHHLKSSHRINPSIMKLDPIMKKYIVGGEKSGGDDVTGTLRCHYCRTALPTDSELAEHLRTMHAQFASFTRITAKDNSDNYDCQRCHRVFQTVDEIQVHFVDDHGPGRRMKNKHASEILGIFRCREEGCFWESRVESELESHMKEKHPSVKYDCHQCHFTTSLCYKLDEHLPKHTSKFICDLCGKECRKNFALKTHKFRKHNIQDASLKVHKCEFDGCRFTCFQKSSLKGHMIKHQKDKPFTCPTCGRSLKTAQSLEMHNNKVHKGIRPYMCEICGRGFSKQCEIRAHVRQHSSDRLKCEHCKFSTMNKYSLISHLLSRHNIQVRENEKLFHCPMCDYKTMREKHLTNHINSHLNVREFICSKCGKSFVSANSLRGHNNWVHSEKRYRCDFCSYRGGSLSNLKQHVRIMHTQRGLKPYKCAYCDFRCELSGNCRVHCRSAHKGLEIKWVKVVDFNLDLPKKGLLGDDFEDEELPTMVPTTSQTVTSLPLEAQLSATPPPLQTTVQIPVAELHDKKDSALAHELQQEIHEVHDIRDLREMAAAQEARESEIGRQSAPPSSSHTPQPVMYQQDGTGQVMYADPHTALYLSEPIPTTTRTTYYSTDGNLYDVQRAQLYMPHDAHTGHVYQHGMYTN